MERLGADPRAMLGAAPPETAAITEIAAAWPRAVGSAIAAAAWPNRIGRDGALHVATVSSVWAFELGRMERELLGRLQLAVPGVHFDSLRFAIGPVPEATVPGETLPASPDPTPADRAQASALAAGIADDELRETVARAAAASLARARSDRRFW